MNGSNTHLSSSLGDHRVVRVPLSLPPDHVWHHGVGLHLALKEGRATLVYMHFLCDVGDARRVCNFVDLTLET